MTNFGTFQYGALVALAAGALVAGGAQAADLAAPETAAAVAAPSMLDVAFGVAGATDYRFRGVSNSAKYPVVQGYAEIQAYDWVYAGVWASNVRFPTPWYRNDPAAEIDLYGGLRHSWGALTLDVGGLYYYYPGSDRRLPTPGARAKFDYWELYAKPTILVGDFGAVSGNLYWTSDFTNLGSDALYVSVIPKINIPVRALPSLGFYASGEFGKQFLSTTRSLPINYNWKDYLTWNVGGGVAYKAMTFDVRYSDTDLSKSECAFNYNVRNLCGGAVVAKLSFDAYLSGLK